MACRLLKPCKPIPVKNYNRSDLVQIAFACGDIKDITKKTMIELCGDIEKSITLKQLQYENEEIKQPHSPVRVPPPLLKPKKPECADLSHLFEYSMPRSPPYQAKDCKWLTKVGNDYNIWQSIPDKNGVYSWHPLTNYY